MLQPSTQTQNLGNLSWRLYFWWIIQTIFCNSIRRWSLLGDKAVISHPKRAATARKKQSHFQTVDEIVSTCSLNSWLKQSVTNKLGVPCCESELRGYTKISTFFCWKFLFLMLYNAPSTLASFANAAVICKPSKLRIIQQKSAAH